MCKSSLDRDPQAMCKNMLVAGRVLRQAHPLTINHDDRPRPPARLHSPLEVALRDGPTRATVAASVPRVDARFHLGLGGKSPAGGRRGPGEVSARTEMIHMAIPAVRGSDRVNGLRTARMAIWIIAVWVSHHDLHVLRTGRWLDPRGRL